MSSHNVSNQQVEMSDSSAQPKVNFVFAAFSWFSFGGLTRDMEKIARHCMTQGHSVKIYVSEIKDSSPEAINDLSKNQKPLDIEVLRVSAMSNHKKNKAFENQLQMKVAQLKSQLSSQAQHKVFVVGFNKMHDLDAYYAADSCFATKPSLLRMPLLKLLPRYQVFLKQEHAVFSQYSQTRLLMISEAEIQDYQQCYATQQQRFYLLPPGIDKKYQRPQNAKEVRNKKRQELGLNTTTQMCLFVGSGFKTKGLDRAILLIKNLVGEKIDCQFFIAGQDDFSRYQKMLDDYNLQQHVKFLGPRDDIKELILAADVLLHPAYRENTGTVLLEAAISGLPVLTTDACGYAKYIENFELGAVIDAPYSEEQFLAAFKAIMSTDKQRWIERAQQLLDKEDVFGLHQQAARLLIEWAQA